MTLAARPRNYQRPWSSQEDNILRTSVAQEFSMERIQIILERHADRRNLSKRTHEEILERMAQIDQVIAEQGDIPIPGSYLSILDISRGMGIPISRILSWIQDKDFNKCLKPRRFGATWGIPERGFRRFLRRYPGEVALAVRRADIDLIWVFSVLFLVRGED